MPHHVDSVRLIRTSSSRRIALALSLGVAAALAQGCKSKTPATSSVDPPAQLAPAAQEHKALVEAGTPAAAASPAEKAASKQQNIDALIAEALTAPQLGDRTIAALKVSDRAVAALADTITAIDAAQRIIVDNLRNVDTTGYKSTRTSCGEGRDVTCQIDVAQGELRSTGRPLDVAISGEGFFQVKIYTPQHPQGSVGYTRNGNLLINKEGELVCTAMTANTPRTGGVAGYQLLPPIALPADATEVTVNADGVVECTIAGKGLRRTVGRIGLTRFLNPSSLQGVGGGIYLETDSSGRPIECPPGENGAGTITQGYLEASNVDLTRERLRLRFLQNWRGALFRAIDGEENAER